MSAHKTLDLTGFGLPYWLDFERPTYPVLEERISADVTIIGAGIAGLKIADCLDGHGMSSVIVDDRRVGEGASARNQGCIVTGLSTPYSQLIQNESREMAQSLVSLSYYNQDLLVGQIERHAVACDYESLGETSLVRADEVGTDTALQSLSRDAQLLREDGFEAELLDEKQTRAITNCDLFAGGLRFPRDAQFHSGRFVVGLGAAIARSHNVRLFEGSRAIAIERSGDDHVVRTPRGVVHSKHLFVATNALAPQLLPSLTTSLRAERGQVFVTEPLDVRPCTGCFGGGLAWWRDIQEKDGRYRLLFGGARRREEGLFVQYASNGKPNPRLATEGFRPSVNHQRSLAARFREIFPQLAGTRITHRWGGLQSFTYDGLPVIGLLDTERRIHGMAGFSGLGNSFSNVGAEYLAARIAGKTSEAERQFGSTLKRLLAPQRNGVCWPGPDPTKARADTMGVNTPDTGKPN